MSRSRPQTPEQRIAFLRRVLSLERRKGFDDSAMTGGLEAFVRATVHDLATSNGGDARLERLDRIFADYAVQSPDERRTSIEAAEEILGSPASPAHAAPPTPEKPKKSAPPATGSRRARRRASVRLASLDEPVSVLPGVGEQREKQLETLGVRTVRDLLYLVPRQHKDFSRVTPIGSALFNRECTVRGRVTEVNEERTRTGKVLVTVTISDDTGSMPLIWFNPYIARQMRIGLEIAVSGRIEQQRGTVCMRGPEWEPVEAGSIHTGRLVPFYPLTRGLYQKQLRNLTRLALDAAAGIIYDPLPAALRERHRLFDLATALEGVHYPASVDELHFAKARLAFDEFLVLQIGLVRRKVEWQKQNGHAFDVDRDTLARFAEVLPFEFTPAQRRALQEILDDMGRPKPMSRLLQGDVGSGKTVVAAAAVIVAHANGFQSAILAPTEILAEQHDRNFRGLFADLPETQRPAVALLTGSTPAKERERIDGGLRAGEIDVLIGTHAILEQRVDFRRLGLAVIDEQHRFGVRQRARLRGKGESPDILVMTATPIPRSLALVMHGDLDVSIIDELPPGRQPITTRLIEEERRGDVYRFIRSQVQAGRQAFIIYPLVEDSEVLDLRAATSEFERLSREVFPDLRLGLLHGRMRPSEKDDIMTRFRDRDLDVLVSTSVVEVGIDVPNATVMVIEGAERFGLSQLHQFRGRVGRGADRSYCLLIAANAGEGSQRRLEAMVETQDGFRLAEIDLELRGPGEFFGTRQSGLPDLQFAVLGDLATLQRARDEAHHILEHDPALVLPEHAALRASVERFWSDGMGDRS
jgi:ATP-dependent DNA helicase RecG